MRTGPAVKDDQRAIVGPDLDARSIAAVAERRRSRLGEGAPSAPEADPHDVSPLRWPARLALSILPQELDAGMPSCYAAPHRSVSCSVTCSSVQKGKKGDA